MKRKLLYPAGILLLLFCVSGLTFLLVQLLNPVRAAIPRPASPPPAESPSPQPDQYTPEDLEFALSLKTEDYAAQSASAFAAKLADWTNEDLFHTREACMARLKRTYQRDGADADFILRTLTASMGEAASRHYGGYCTSLTEQFTDTLSRERYEDVFGDPYLVFQAELDYCVHYSIPDGTQLTVGERDRILNAYRDALFRFLGGKSEVQLCDDEAMKKELTDQFKHLDQTLSTAQMILSDSELRYYGAWSSN